MNDSEALLKRYSDHYGDLLPLRTILSLIPGGSQLDMILSAPGQKFVEERLTYMLDEVKAEVEALGQDKIDKSFFETEEGYDLMNMTFSAVARTRQKTKLKAFAKILIGAATAKAENNDPELYFRIADEISEKELEIAKVLYDVKVRKTVVEMGRNDRWYPQQFPQFTAQEFEVGFVRLVKIGLIQPRTGFDSSGSYQATSLLSGFLEFIKTNNEAADQE